MKKLKTGNGNLIGRVEKLKVMGVKAKKNLPAVNEAEEENKLFMFEFGIVLRSFDRKRFDLKK